MILLPKLISWPGGISFSDLQNVTSVQCVSDDMNGPVSSVSYHFWLSDGKILVTCSAFISRFDRKRSDLANDNGQPIKLFCFLSCIA